MQDIQYVSRPGMDKPAERLTRERQSEFESAVEQQFLLITFGVRGC